MPPTPSANVRIAIVDDEIDMLNVYREILRAEGYQVEQFQPTNDQTEPVLNFLKKGFDLILCDYHMPVDWQVITRYAMETKTQVAILTGDPEIDLPENEMVTPVNKLSAVGSLPEIVAGILNRPSKG